MRILFCHPAADFSVSDVARGYRAALERAGHIIRDYRIDQRMAYHIRAVGEQWKDNISAISKQASETIIVEALYHQADYVVLVSALVYHPLGIQLLRQAGIKLIVIHTESPYEDESQREWANSYPEAIHCTHERVSAEAFGWVYLPHAYDPAIHRPLRSFTKRAQDGRRLSFWDNEGAENESEPCDVLFLGTGWQNRIDLFEAVDWTGIKLRLYGLWPALAADSPLRPYYVEGCVENQQAVALYRAAKICLNLHRAPIDCAAASLNPRAYELAAIGAFTITDYRMEGYELFGDAQPIFDRNVRHTQVDAAELGRLVRHYIAHPLERKLLAEQARSAVISETFDTRVATLMAALHQSAQAA